MSTRASRRAILAVSVALALTTGSVPRDAGAATMYTVLLDRFLMQFDSASPSTITRLVPIQGLQTPSERVLGIDFRPRTGQLFLATVPVGAVSNAIVRTYFVQPLTGAATFVGSIPSSTVPGAADVSSGFDFNPSVDRMRVVNAINENFRINPNNGTLAGNDPDLTGTASQVVALAYDRNFDRANATTIPTTLYGIARGSSQLVVQGGLNGAGPGGANGGVVSNIGPLGLTVAGASDVGFDIDAAGTAYAAIRNAATGLSGLYTVNLTTGTATLVGTIADGTLPVTGLAVAPRSLVIAGAGTGGGPQVRVLDAATGDPLPAPLGSFFAFDPNFTGGVRVALGDVNGDGVADVIVGAGPGGVPLVQVLNGRTGVPLPGPLGFFFAFDPAFSGGVNVAAGDINGDGFEDVIVAADAGGKPQVRVFSGQTGAELLSFFAYDAAFTGGVRVAAADFNLDGRAEIVTAGGPGGGPHIGIFDNAGNLFTASGGLQNSFFAYDAGFTGGVFVAAGDVNGDGVPDIVTGADAGAVAHVKAFSGKDGSVIISLLAYEPSFAGGVRVAVGDVNNDGRKEILTVPGPGRSPEMQAFDGLTAAVVQTSFPLNPLFTGGVFVGASRR